MGDTTTMSPGSVMPAYPWLLDDNLDTASTRSKIRAMQKLGVPYAAGFEDKANEDLMQQANSIVESLKKDKIETPPTKEIIALIAYLQRIGKDIKLEETASN